MTTGRICSKCHYQRKPSDDDFCPEYECPKCGVMYAKVGESKQKAESALEAPEKANDGPKNRFRFSGNRQVATMAALILIAGSVSCYFVFFSTTDLSKLWMEASSPPTEHWRSSLPI